MNEQNRFVCPFRMVANAIRASGADCLEERCAWWMKDEMDIDYGGYCVVHRIGGDLEDIHEDLDDIGYWMKPENR